MFKSLSPLLLFASEHQTQVAAMAIFVSTLIMLRSLSAGRTKALNGEHTLNMEKLNSAVLFKEVFLAYLNAALLEPGTCHLTAGGVYY